MVALTENPLNEGNGLVGVGGYKWTIVLLAPSFSKAILLSLILFPSLHRHASFGTLALAGCGRCPCRAH